MLKPLSFDGDGAKSGLINAWFDLLPPPSWLGASRLECDELGGALIPWNEDGWIFRAFCLCFSLSHLMRNERRTRSE